LAAGGQPAATHSAKACRRNRRRRPILTTKEGKSAATLFNVRPLTDNIAAAADRSSNNGSGTGPSAGRPFVGAAEAAPFFVRWLKVRSSRATRTMKPRTVAGKVGRKLEKCKNPRFFQGFSCSRKVGGEVTVGYFPA